MLAIIKCPKCKTIQYVSYDATKLKLSVLCENDSCEIFFSAAYPIKVFNPSNN